VQIFFCKPEKYKPHTEAGEQNVNPVNDDRQHSSLLPSAHTHIWGIVRKTDTIPF
jgi:hypothetical protein